MDVDVRKCTWDDLQRLRSVDVAASARRHHEERWGWQEAGTAVYLLAWRNAEAVGRATVLRRSKYEAVRNVVGDAPEVNALAASWPSQGIGTAIMQVAEQQATSWGATVIGLGVAPDNDRARRLYNHLGYLEWDHGVVVDRWMERDAGGAVLKAHADECLYLTKTLTSFTSSHSSGAR